MRESVFNPLGIALQRGDRGPGESILSQAGDDPDAWREIQPEGMHALRRACMRFGLSGGRVYEDSGGTGGLRRNQVHGMPVLHGGVSVPGADIRVEFADANGEQVRLVQ